MKFNKKKPKRKSPNPLWFRTFLRRYLNRFAMLVAERGFDGLCPSFVRFTHEHPIMFAFGEGGSNPLHFF